LPFPDAIKSSTRTPQPAPIAAAEVWQRLRRQAAGTEKSLSPARSPEQNLNRADSRTGKMPLFFTLLLPREIFLLYCQPSGVGGDCAAIGNPAAIIARAL
jgi:hypothetical protein